MSEKTSHAERLEAVLFDQLANAADAAQKGLRPYESLRNLGEVIGGEYGDRVLFELFQNAHDAHDEGGAGSILLKLVIHDDERGDLYVANTGRGFDWDNVDSIRNVGLSSKSVGEGIGNKGLGFRSVETLTNDVRIYSQARSVSSAKFDGYCFRFADRREIEREAMRVTSAETAAKVARELPRYLAAVPLAEQSDEIRAFAEEGFATVVHLPLRSEAAVSMAQSQARALAEVEVPLLLFLERLENVVIELHDAEGVTRRKLSRRVLERPKSGDDSRIAYEVVSIGPGRRRYLVARRQVDRDRLVSAVEASIDKEAQLARWRDWQGDPKVSVAIPLNATDAEPGRIYNFLPMAAEMPSPLAGHIDAPFYATIDRRRANFDLPLNAFLLDEVADTAVQAALELKSMPDVAFRNAVFDLAAWNPKDLDRLERVCAGRELDWRDLELVPETGGKDLWCSFQSAYVWEEKGYRLLRVRRLIKAGIENIADPDLGELRLDRICDMLGAIPLRAIPNEQDLSSWLELVAGSLVSDGSSPKTWGTFYEECRKALPSVAALTHLGGKQVLRTRDGIQAAMGIEGEMPVFVREATGKRRKSGEAPLPPKSIASKFSMLDDDVPLSPEIISEFVKAKLVRRYDALEVLAEVPASFGNRPAPKRREEALKWAFEVWRAEGAKCEKVLDRIDLHVETTGGWRPATEARFSDGWTAQGRSLTTFLAEASSLSPDCREAAGMLLVSDASWIPKSAPLRKEWTEFLRVVGVEDGLPLLVDDTAPESGAPIYVWNAFLRQKEKKVGRTAAWVAANSSIPLHNPWTDYSRRGELWRFPGQLEHQKMPPEARRRLAELAMVQAARGTDEWAQWRLGRYDRFRSDWNETVFRTPAAVFLAKSRWMPVDGDDERFLRPDELWATTDGRRNPPRYVQRPKDRLVKLIESEEELSSALFSTAIGLRDWSSIGQVPAKLAAMATGASILHPGERVPFRKAYQQAWNEACSSEVDLPSDLPVFVMTSTGPAVSCGDPDDRPRIFVTGDQHSPETRAVLAAGEAVLALTDEAVAVSAIGKLNDSGAFDALPIDAGQVGVLVDGIPLVVSNSDPLLASDGLEWLPEAAILANEVLGQALERQIPGGTIAERLRRVRLRRAGTIQLSVGGKAVEEPLRFYALPDDDHPTLVVGDDEDITWSVLAEAAPALSTLLDGRMRSFETLLLRLAARRSTDDPRCPPSAPVAQI
ncbi:ATP-binding protein [Roseibium sp.]|uniref:ATP-binding protein n=1 Tax=Roseibium sp. TaxID=1936156 RepID=UPI00329A688A